MHLPLGFPPLQRPFLLLLKALLQFVEVAASCPEDCQVGCWAPLLLLLLMLRSSVGDGG